jgi:hypothetical protein
MAGAEKQPNRDINRRELLKSIGRGTLIVGGTALGMVSGKDLYSALKEDKESLTSPIIENTQREIRDVWGGLIGTGLATMGGIMVRDARQTAPEPEN